MVIFLGKRLAVTVRHCSLVLTARVILLAAITIHIHDATAISDSDTDYGMANQCLDGQTTLNLTNNRNINIYLKRSGMILENPLTCTIKVIYTTQGSMYVRFFGNYKIGLTGFFGISMRQRNKEGITIYHETPEGYEYVVGRATANWFGAKGSLFEHYPRSMARLSTMKIETPFFIFYTGDPGDDNFQIQISHNDFNQCDDNKMSPCLNGGTCIDGHMNYTCICKIGYLGDRCAEKVRPSCSIGTPCSNHNQKCIQLNNTHHRCDCITGYNGPDCMESVCEPNPCLNGAECIIVTKARCICENGYRGPFCQSHVCQVQNPCRNGGTCISITRWPGYDCTCTSGYRGDTCSAVRSYYKKKPQPLGSRVIAGIVFASLFGAAAIIVALFFIIRRYRKPPSSPYREPNSIGYGTHTWQNANDHIHPPVRDPPTLTPEQTHRAEIRGMLRDLSRDGNQSNANRINHNNSTSQPTTRELNPIRSVNLDNNSLPVRYDPNGSPPDYTEALDDRYKLPSPEITEEPPPSYDTVHLNALRLENDFYPRSLNNEHSNASSSEQRTLRGGSTENNNNEELNSDVQSPQTTDQSDSPRSPGNNTQINLNTLAMPTRNIHDTTVNTVNSNPAVIDNVPIEDLEETIL